MTQGGHNRSAELVRVRAGDAADMGRLSRLRHRRAEAIASRHAPGSGPRQNPHQGPRGEGGGHSGARVRRNGLDGAATRRRNQESFAVIRNDRVGAAERGGVMTPNDRENENVHTI